VFYRLIKPNWAKPKLANNEPNPEFKKEISGPNVIEGCLTEDKVNELNNLGYNAYFFPNHPDHDVYTEGTKHLSGKLIKVFNYVFVDMDLKDGDYKSVEAFLDVVSQFPVKPTMTVASGNGVHVYWKMKNLTREDYIITQMALLNHFNTDQSVWTVLQLMRVPGSLNTKQLDNFKRSEIIEVLSSNEVYTVDQLPEYIYNLNEQQKTKIKNHLNKLDGKTEIQFSEDVNVDELPDSFINIMGENDTVNKLFTDPKGFYGDRSGADMKLANILYNRDYPKKEALVVIANTEKALSKGYARFDYAQLTIDKVYVDRSKNNFKTVGQRVRQGAHLIEKDYVKGPYYFDCLTKKWAKKQILGLIGGTGVGKTAVTLKTMKSMIENNLEVNDDVYIFFSLEMPENEIIERWLELVGETSPLADRLYVIGNEDEYDEPRNIGLQEIYEYCNDIKKQTGKELGAVAIDHIGILGLHIDMRKKHKFGVESEKSTGNGDKRTISLNLACTQVKSLAKMLDTFIILLTQTTKEKGVGYTPLGKDAAYGISQYENIVDYMITIWQPLALIQHTTELRILAWQYAKIRHKHKDDPIQQNQYKLLTYDMATGNLTPPSEEEYLQFSRLMPEALDAIKAKAEKKELNYSVSLSKEVLQDIDYKLKLVNTGKQNA
jgi:hypothetical protein